MASAFESAALAAVAALLAALCACWAAGRPPSPWRQPQLRRCCRRLGLLVDFGDPRLVLARPLLRLFDGPPSESTLVFTSPTLVRTNFLVAHAVEPPTASTAMGTAMRTF